MTDMTVSVIVPVYNCEAYLETCVDSLLNQDHSALEIILVDDGATDGSGTILVPCFATFCSPPLAAALCAL